ncbi:MAG TPA: TIGR02569 family protein [Mycobacteriales bacterium]|nr:TIGR02569 family protein [Mycobacteriales bacterium]
MTPAAPPARVLAAFGCPGDPVPLAGGQGECWRAGDVVLKPAPDDAALLASVMADVVETPAFRVARPVASADGWVCAGWTAWTFVPGRHRDDRIADEVAVCDAFHAALAHLPRPAFETWSLYRQADAVAWGEAAYDGGGPGGPLLDRLAALREPVGLPDQLVHGDLGGNVLFADGLPPAVIDPALYWRPAAYARAVVVADAVTWRGADPAVLDLAPFGCVVRAVAFRVAASAGRGEGPRPALLRTVELLERRQGQ